MNKDRKKQLAVALGVFGALTLSLGCRRELPVAFESNLVHSHKYAMTKDLPMDQVVDDTDWAMRRMFGTPDDPKVPDLGDEEIASLVSLERLQVAGGKPVLNEKGYAVTGLYRQYCVECHGVTGNGRGPTGAILTPYPRDYRMGVFKFKSTSRGAKPTREDLATLIRDGIAGTSMKPIEGMTEEGVQALVDYVIYLSWRGEVERKMVDSAMFDLDLSGGERLIRPENAGLADEELAELTEAQSEQVDELQTKVDEKLRADVLAMVKQDKPDAAEEDLEGLVDERLDEMEPAEKTRMIDKIVAGLASADALAAWNLAKKIEGQESYQENWGFFTGTAEEVAGEWLAAEEEITEIEDAGDIPVPASKEEFVAMMAGPEADALKASVARGHELFLSEAVGCAKCHGKEGKGDGQTADYDDWTKDWTVNVGLDPKNRDQLVPLLARGALPPQNIHPRNFAEGIFRGGSKPEDIFRRISNGIAGTPMPAAPVIEGTFERQDIWHIINYIRSLDQSSNNEMATAPAQPAAAESAAL